MVRQSDQSVTSQRRSGEDSMPTTLTIDEMKAKVRSHFEDFVNNRKAEVIRTNMTSDFYDHDCPCGQPTDVSGDEQMMRQMYSVMPDLHLTIEDLIAEDDKVVCKNHWHWTDPESTRRSSMRSTALAHAGERSPCLRSRASCIPRFLGSGSTTASTKCGRSSPTCTQTST
jgi:predicted ester cyclase